MTKIKICGIRSPQDIFYLNGLKPDLAGFVFYAGSKRYINEKSALHLRQMLDMAIGTVGVFVDESIEVIKSLYTKGIIETAQLHGTEDEIYIKKLKDCCDIKIIKAFIINNDSDLQFIEKSSCDIVLLDAGAGSGRTFNWDLANNISRDFFLAGGLNFSNIDEALEKVHPYGVDVSSGVESNGIKDADKIYNFISKVKSIDTIKKKDKQDR